MARRYHLLVASLPWLPHFARARALPISRERLSERLRLLDREDEAVVRSAEDALEWQRQPSDRTDAAVVETCERMTATAPRPVLREMILFRMTQRTLVAALRRRALGRRPGRGERWGIGPWTGHLARHWDEPDFRLAAVHPWLPIARGLLERGDVLALERLLMERVWRHLDLLQDSAGFDLDAVLVYLFKWDILDRWLQHDESSARGRFEALGRAARGGHGIPGI